MALLTLHWGDVSGMNRLDNAMGRLNSGEKHLALQRGINHTGDKALTQVTRELARQTGLQYRVVKKALKVTKAGGGYISGGQAVVSTGASLTYTIRSQGGDISLKYFKARETRKGVTAAPFGKRKLFPGTFMKGGRFPNRVPASGLNGHVYRRVGKGRGPLEFLNSGVIIPAEMLKGASAKAFNDVVQRDLPPRVMHEIDRLSGGIFD